MCLRKAPEKYIAGAKAPAGAALDRAGLENVGPSTSHNRVGLHGLLQEHFEFFTFIHTHTHTHIHTNIFLWFIVCT
jgi:hypothetical protein